MSSPIHSPQPPCSAPEKPRLHTNSQTVSLSFETSLIQSCMRLDDPDELVLDYTRAMMGGLLLQPTPASVLMIGLGGGAMLKYLYRHLPRLDITAVEINQAVIDLRHDFHIPPDGDRLRILCADGAAFLQKPPRRYDLILVDGFTGAGLPDALCSPGFYRRCKAALAEQGLLVANVQADNRQTAEILARMAKAFPSGVITAASDEGGNEIAFAGSPDMLSKAMTGFEQAWAALAPVHQATLAVVSTRIQRALLRRNRAQPGEASAPR